MSEREDKDGGTVLKIKGSMSVFDIAESHKEIVACFNKGVEFTLDLEGVNDCDISGLQLLYSARKTANSCGKTFSIINASDSIIDIFNRAGLNPETVLAKNFEIQNSKNDKEVSNGQSHHDG